MKLGAKKLNKLKMIMTGCKKKKKTVSNKNNSMILLEKKKIEP
jgi:hypothetical protein